MSKEVKRYDCTDGGARFCQGCYTMSECEFGEYVSWDDYEALLAERDDLLRQVETLTDWYSNILNVINEVTAALPGVQYMDPPDGGDVSVPEQVRRMAKDAERNERMLLAACVDMGAIGEALGADMNSDGEELLSMVVEMKAERDALLAERDRMEKDAVRFREIVAAVVREHPHRSASRGNAPGHGHSLPGVWDSDNGALAGTECAWCKTWNEAIAALQGEQP